MNHRLLPTLVLVLGAASGQALAQGSGAPAASAVASAPASAPATDAEHRYAEAQAHFLAGRYTEALPIFQQLYAESGSPNASLYVARCLREMGQLPEAYDEMVATERNASERARSEERFVATRESARTELRDLERRVGRVTLNVPARPPGLEIEIDGKPVPPERWGSPLPVMPGTVRVWATAPGQATVRQEVEVRAGTEPTITVFMAPAGSGPSGPVAGPSGKAEAAPAPDAGKAGPSGLLVGGAVAIGLGVLGMGTFVVSGVLANGRFSDIKDKCGGQRCTDPSINSSIREGHTMDIVADVGLGVGVAGLVLGGILVTVDQTAAPAASPDAPRGPAHALWLDGVPGGGTVGYRVSF